MAAGRGGTMEEPRLKPHCSRRILILAPHPDDEIVACGIAARRARAGGAEVFVLFLTSGVPPRETLWPWQRGKYNRRAERRREEASAATMLLGVQPVGFLDIPSRRLIPHLHAAAAAVDRALREFAPASSGSPPSKARIRITMPRMRWPPVFTAGCRSGNSPPTILPIGRCARTGFLTHAAGSSNCGLAARRRC